MRTKPWVVTIVAIMIAIHDAPVRAQSTGDDVAAVAASIGSTTDRLLERMWNPTVHVDGKIAILRAPYDFHRNGTFSHCGVDTMTLRRIASTWRIVRISYTVQREKCSPSPLGAPKP